ncbi:DUF72 domain-containing protein [Comamonas sp. GB3 AK4-5]|uniref:DUF72 domain-containing protein n=1 Tax=Comamonas sp. GB3 AK4-5 TaxID=3231487 RepID=UPI00351E3828
MQDDLFGAPAGSKPAAPLPPPSTHRTSARGVQPAPAGQAFAALAAQLPAGLRMGVSTWSYPGWDGLVWDGQYDASTLSKKGLTAYSQHPLLRTVSVDRSFWRPLTVEQYAQMAVQVPEDFRFLIKCPNVVTDAQVRSEDGKGQSPNPAFLAPELAVQQFALPALQGLSGKLGVLLFQLSPLPWDWLRQNGALLQALGQMLAAVRQAIAAHPQVIVAVEVRDPELLTPALAQVLKTHGATYCLGLHGKMPPLAEQLPLLRALWPGPLVCRWSLNRCFGAYGYPDAQKKHDPFNEIRSEDPSTRALLARTIAGITGAGQPAFVTISNDAEGCAPRSIALLAQAVQAQTQEPLGSPAKTMSAP